MGEDISGFFLGLRTTTYVRSFVVSVLVFLFLDDGDVVLLVLISW